MLALLMLAAAVQPTPPAPSVAKPGETVIREVVIRQSGDAKPGAKDKQERREIIITRDGKDAAAAKSSESRIRVVEVGPSKGKDRREVRVLREVVVPGARITMTSCDDLEKFDRDTTDKDGKQTRVMFCATGGSNVSKVQQLRDAAKRIEADSMLSPEARTQIIAAINEAIAKLPASE